MRKSMLTLSVAAALARRLASAQPPAAAPRRTVTGNMASSATTGSAASRRPISEPAIQGGIDYSHASGFYVGNWNSNVSRARVHRRLEHRDGLLRRLQEELRRRRPRRRHALLLLPAAPSSRRRRQRQDRQLRALRRRAAGSGSPPSTHYALSDYFGLASEQSAGGYWTYRDTGALLGSTGVRTALVPRPERDDTGHQAAFRDRALRDARGQQLQRARLQGLEVGVTYDLGGWILGAAYVGHRRRRAAGTTPAARKGNQGDRRAAPSCSR